MAYPYPFCVGSDAWREIAKRGVEGLEDGEHLVQRGDLKDLQYPSIGHHQPYLSSRCSDPLQVFDQHAHAGRVQKRDFG